MSNVFFSFIQMIALNPGTSWVETLKMLVEFRHWCVSTSLVRWTVLHRHAATGNEPLTPQEIRRPCIKIVTTCPMMPSYCLARPSRLQFPIQLIHSHHETLPSDISDQHLPQEGFGTILKRMAIRSRRSVPESQKAILLAN
jgi:hypothetical protein